MCCPSASSTGWASSRGARWPAAGCPAATAREPTLPTSSRAQRLPHRFDLSLPGNQAKLAAAEQLAVLAEESGLSLIQLALAFVVQHPAVTSAIIGPRTMEHLDGQLAAAGVTLDAAVLDRIDEIVPPGTNLNQRDRGYEPPALTTPALRRRPGQPSGQPGAHFCWVQCGRPNIRPSTSCSDLPESARASTR